MTAEPAFIDKNEFLEVKDLKLFLLLLYVNTRKKQLFLLFITVINFMLKK